MTFLSYICSIWIISSIYQTYSSGLFFVSSEFAVIQQSKTNTNLWSICKLSICLMGTNHLWNDIKKAKNSKIKLKIQKPKIPVKYFYFNFYFYGVFILFTTTTLMLCYTLFVTNILKWQICYLHSLRNTLYITQLLICFFIFLFFFVFPVAGIE